ncbi:hypothetical protein [Clostridium minihomine]|uniref:hypothetical protein n=1 Tax=Clostridium minihomine TaxID=2045012 RepID=UPI000C775761|nr:hypothetical protein [Clostridium minihomine]
MEIFIPRRQSVFIEMNGIRLAFAQKVTCRCVRERRAIRAFGEAEPVAFLERPSIYRLELRQLSLCGEGAAQTSLYGMSNFRLVAVQDGVRTTYSGCEWEELEELAEPGDGVLAERAVITAKKRVREE